MMFWALARVSFRAAKIVSCNKNLFFHGLRSKLPQLFYFSLSLKIDPMRVWLSRRTNLSFFRCFSTPTMKYYVTWLDKAPIYGAAKLLASYWLDQERTSEEAPAASKVAKNPGDWWGPTWMMAYELFELQEEKKLVKLCAIYCVLGV
jgi:hypothetical protein